MAGFTKTDLRRWRMSQGISADELSMVLNVDPSTYYRYESDKYPWPDIDTMYQICRELGDVSRWCDWMRQEFRSYREIHPEIPKHDLRGAIMGLSCEIRDIEDIERSLVKDGSDGLIDNPVLAGKTVSELTELIQVATRLKILIEEGGR